MSSVRWRGYTISLLSPWDPSSLSYDAFETGSIFYLVLFLDTYGLPRHLPARLCVMHSPDFLKQNIAISYGQEKLALHQNLWMERRLKSVATSISSHLAGVHLKLIQISRAQHRDALIDALTVSPDRPLCSR